LKLTTANCDFSANAGCFLDSTSALYIFTPLFAPVALQLGNRGAYLVQKMQDKLVEHRQYIRSRSPMWSARTRRFSRSLLTLPPSP